MQIRRITSVIALLILISAAGACAKKKPPVARPVAPPPATAATPTRPPAPPQPVAEPQPVPAEPVPAEDTLASKDIDEINRNSPFQPVFFGYDQAEVDEPGQQALNVNAELMKKYGTWIVTIEGHCDERGTAEYNLALGERRALAARNYLVALGIPADRLRTVSYGKEFPFDPGHDESAWSKNRRAHFVVTSK
ncbi:MAG: peptidoglycan-associated lipoprotein [Acidobacteria bacterium RIFCSPLOWO2_02_FULL_67_36]|nr:MAG: peptidoglycan-associated lipoprotein [Acidobacteria bacterium RIFCSPLOWO2_02_FULL_67_36]OFW18657.1 MAG: peptidoglycan-associated lipoprotein [Acidobacteria bacterium RIFCSPLOWO2_12_FULL_66_21]